MNTILSSQSKFKEQKEMKGDLLRFNGESPITSITPPLAERKNFTKNSIPEKVRTQMVTLIQNKLSESIHLKLRIKNSHWNIKGKHFTSLHHLFDELSEDIDKFSDILAERILQLGGIVESDTNHLLSLSQLPPSIKLESESDHLNFIEHNLAYFSEETRKMIGLSEKLCDPVTTDIFTDLTRLLEKQLWLVESNHHFFKSEESKKNEN